MYSENNQSHKLLSLSYTKRKFGYIFKKKNFLQNELLLIDILKDNNFFLSNFLYINIAFCSDNFFFFFSSIRSNFFKFYYLKENNCIFNRYKFYLIILFSYLYIKYI